MDVNGWIQVIVGPLGALIVMIFVGWRGFLFFKNLLADQETRHDKQEDKLIKLHTSTLEGMSANTAALTRLGDQLAQHITG